MSFEWHVTYNRSHIKMPSVTIGSSPTDLMREHIFNSQVRGVMFTFDSNIVGTPQK